MKKITILLLLFVSVLLLTGCEGYKYKYHSNYTNEEIIEVARSYIREELLDYGKYSLKVIDKKPLEVCIFAINECSRYKTIKGAYEYTVEVTNNTTGRKESRITVKDRYYKGDNVIIPNARSDNFISNQKYYERYDKLISLLGNYSTIKYYLIDDQTKTDVSKIVQDGYIYAPNYSELESFIYAISKSQYEYYWNFLITNELDEYNEFLNNKNDIDDSLNLYESSETISTCDLSAFENNSKATIRNTSQGSSTCVTTVLIKK